MVEFSSSLNLLNSSTLSLILGGVGLSSCITFRRVTGVAQVSFIGLRIGLRIWHHPILSLDFIRLMFASADQTFCELYIFRLKPTDEGIFFKPNLSFCSQPIHIPVAVSRVF